MKRPGHFFLAVLLFGALLLTGIWVWASRVPDPVYEGRPLSQWLLPVNMNSFISLAEIQRLIQQQERMKQAVHTVGTNSIPLLLSMLAAHDSPAQRRLHHWLIRHPRWRMHPVEDFQRNAGALDGFLVLGSAARTAVPAMLERYEQAPARSILRQTFPAAFGQIGPGAAAAAPALARAVTNAPTAVGKLNAIFALAKIRASLDLTVANLTLALADPDPEVRIAAAGALGEIGPSANAALPALHQLRDSERAGMWPPYSLHYYLPLSDASAKIWPVGPVSSRRAANEAIRQISGHPAGDPTEPELDTPLRQWVTPDTFPLPSR